MNQPVDDKGRGYLDKAAIVLSAVCMLHCLALPVLLTVVPIFNTALLSEKVFHLMMLLFIVPISALALTIGCRQHRDTTTMLLGTTGLLILIITALGGHHLFGLTGERLVTSIGGLVLAGAHLQNFRCCRQDNCKHDH